MTDITHLLSALNSPTVKTRRDAAARLADPATLQQWIRSCRH